MTVQERLSEIGKSLPSPPPPKGNYSPIVMHGDVAYVSGQVSRQGQLIISGPIDSRTPPLDIVRAAQTCILNALSILEEAKLLGRVERILFLRGFIFADENFRDHSQVLDSASDFLVEVFGEKGRHARSAIGVAGLPGRGMMEIELTAAIMPRTEADARGHADPE